MGRKSCWCFGKKAEKEEGCYGRTGESLEQPGAAQQVRYYPALLGRPAAGFAQEGPSPRHLLPCVALAGSAEPPRAEALGYLWISFWIQTKGSLHQSIPLQEGGEPRYVWKLLAEKLNRIFGNHLTIHSILLLLWYCRTNWKWCVRQFGRGMFKVHITGGVLGRYVVCSVLMVWTVFFGINHLLPTDFLSLLPLKLVANISFVVK